MSHAKVHLAVNYCILIGLVIYHDYLIMHARLSGAATADADADAALALHLPNSLWRKRYLRDSNMCDGRLVCNNVSGVDTVQIIKGLRLARLIFSPANLISESNHDLSTVLYYSVSYINAQSLLLKTAVN